MIQIGGCRKPKGDVPDVVVGRWTGKPVVGDHALVRTVNITLDDGPDGRDEPVTAKVAPPVTESTHLASLADVFAPTFTNVPRSPLAISAKRGDGSLRRAPRPRPVRELLGHARIDTIQIYARIRPRQLKRAVSFYEECATKMLSE